MSGVKIRWGGGGGGGGIFITILVHFHYFISLETANTQKSEVFLLRISISAGNMNALVGIC